MWRLKLAVVVAAVIATASGAAVDKRNIDAAIDRGVAALKAQQQDNGSYPHTDATGATALAGLTLLECGVPKTDKAVAKAADYVREQSYALTSVYGLSLSIMFLESLGETKDTPLIESMIVRLLAGQRPLGAWGYSTPPINPAEQKRLRAEYDGADGRVLKAGGGRNLSKLPTKGERTVKDLAPEVQQQLNQIAAQIAAKGGFTDIDTHGSAMPDNSNTQFAVLAMWIGRRYGIPVQGPLIAASKYFRASAMVVDAPRAIAGWAYRPPAAGEMMTGGAVTPSMTCAGLVSLATGMGSAHDIRKAKDDKADKPDVTKDPQVMAGLRYLSLSVGAPLGWNGAAPAPPAIRRLTGRDYYTLWSLERICVIFGLETLDRKDWYAWGAEMILASQRADGTWVGDHTAVPDTAFALLFLKKVNLARDLSGGIRGLKDAGVRTMKAGGGLGVPIKEKPDPETKPKTGGETKPTEPKDKPRLDPPSRDPGEGTRPKPATPEEAAARKLLDDAIGTRGERQRAIIDKMREAKGVVYTEALVEGIKRLDPDGRKEARAALAQRFTRLKDTTIRNYFDDEEPEIRRAAVLAGAARGTKSHIPGLIKLLDDPEGIVRRASHEALKSLTGKDFGPARDATADDRRKAMADWTKWHRENSRE